MPFLSFPLRMKWLEDRREAQLDMNTTKSQWCLSSSGWDQCCDIEGRLFSLGRRGVTNLVGQQVCRLCVVNLCRTPERE